MNDQTIRFFWIGEESEIFAAKSWEQILADNGSCGSGVRSDGVSELDGEPAEYGELSPDTLVQFAVVEDNERRTGEIFEGTLAQVIERWPVKSLPEMVLTQYA
ncbi:hypothetical protein X962_2006 [Burkholderia pseudomallei MSHR7343]|uniref:hypothetical protein n=1 Tax=Burkholderia pseudomallei TaxID=28450 RepID=UPI00016AB8C7|nr:hypothetical protein [Burkholderia pseudomallei]KGS34475.1 hypothetical protein X962_2006 [Burkholderia pseudomallei MSHR7343]MBM5648311.1 hypothetical protein [Burkholderia pseudomallei]